MSEVQQDPLYDARLIPTYLAKIGALTIRNELLTARLQEAYEQLASYEDQDKSADE